MAQPFEAETADIIDNSWYCDIGTQQMLLEESLEVDIELVQYHGGSGNYCLRAVDNYVYEAVVTAAEWPRRTNVFSFVNLGHNFCKRPGDRLWNGICTFLLVPGACRKW